MTTTVVNKHRARRRPDDVYVGRGSLFGNPFTQGTRDDVLNAYRGYFLQRMAEPGFRAAVAALKDKRLVCWCRPLGGFEGKLLCHAQFLAAYADGIAPEDVP